MDRPVVKAYRRPVSAVVLLAVAHQFVRDEAPVLGPSCNLLLLPVAEAEASAWGPLIDEFGEMARTSTRPRSPASHLTRLDIIANFVGKTNGR